VITVWAPEGIGEVRRGDDLAEHLLGAVRRAQQGIGEVAGTSLADGDVVCVTSKVVSKAEGRMVRGGRAEAVAAETRRLVARRGSLEIVVNRLGLTMAAAGVDASNVETGTVLLLPEDPDASARALRATLAERTGRNVAVLVTDTAGRAWREGQTDLAIGAAGLVVLDDLAGRVDPYGNTLAVTAPAVADEIAGAAELAAGKLGRRPFVVVRGRSDLVLPAGEDRVPRPSSGDPGATCSGSAPARRCSPRWRPVPATGRRSARRWRRATCGTCSRPSPAPTSSSRTALSSWTPPTRPTSG
jgi:coenzyme F420-0:L-glutamate ligase